MRPSFAAALLLFTTFAASAAGCGPAPAPVATPPAAPVLVGGIHITEHDLGAYTDAVRAAGLDSVQITVYAAQPAWDSGRLRFDPGAAQDVTSLARAAQEAGLGTVLVLRTYLEHGLSANQHLWHGMIWPREDALTEWFARYTAFATWGARLAEDEGIDVFVVGNELNSMTSTTPIDQLPEPLDYFLSRTRQTSVRTDLLECARAADDPRFAEDLRWADGTRYDDLDAALGSADALRHQWARTVAFGAGATHEDLVDPTRIDEAVRAVGARRARLDGEWRGVISEVRDLYSGVVAYGANFDQFEQVGFWDALDAVGVTGYFPLSRYGEEGPGLDASLERAWTEVGARLAAVADRPIYFLELGWTRRRGATVRPWSYGRVEVLETDEPPPAPGAAIPLRCVHWPSQPVEPAERTAALRALESVVRREGMPRLRGLQLWKLSTDPAHAAIEPFAILLGQPEDTALLEAAARIGDVLRSRPSRPRGYTP